MNMYNYSYSGRYMSSASGIYQAGTKDTRRKEDYNEQSGNDGTNNG